MRIAFVQSAKTIMTSNILRHKHYTIPITMPKSRPTLKKEKKADKARMSFICMAINENYSIAKAF